MKQAVPVVGVDVSTHFSDMCVLTLNDETAARMKMYHDLTSMDCSAAELGQVNKEYGTAPVVITESTFH